MGDQQHGLWNHGGSKATFNHPLGEIATYQSDTDTIQWDRAISQNQRDIFLEEVTSPVDDTGVSIDKINVFYGKCFDHEGTDIGYEFSVNVEGNNIVAATITTPNSVACHLEKYVQHHAIKNYSQILPPELTQLGLLIVFQ